MRGFFRLALLALAAAVLLLRGAAAVGAEDAVPLSADAVLRRAFSNLEDMDLTARIELVVRTSGGGARRRVVDTASKRIDSRRHSVARVVEPPDLRGMTILTIEAAGRSQDTFVYLPSQRRIRRVTTAQRGDSFLGSDVTYEDMEPRRIEHFSVESLGSDVVAGEPVFVVRARPRLDASYGHVDFVISKSDHAMLSIHYFKQGASEPFRRVDARREDMTLLSDHVLATRFTVHNRLRAATTEVHLHDLAVNPPIEDRIFSLPALEQQRVLD